MYISSNRVGLDDAGLSGTLDSHLILFVKGELVVTYDCSIGVGVAVVVAVDVVSDSGSVVVVAAMMKFVFRVNVRTSSFFSSIAFDVSIIYPLAGTTSSGRFAQQLVNLGPYMA